MAEPGLNVPHAHQNNGGGGARSNSIFGFQIPNWSPGVIPKLVCKYGIILFQIIGLLAIGVKLGCAMVTTYENSKEVHRARERAQFGIPDSMMSVLKHPHGSLFGRYDKYNQERRLNATLTSGSPSPKDQLDWFDCLDNHIKVAIPSVACSPDVNSNGACTGNRQLLRDLVCTYNGFRYMPQHRMWILVDLDAPDKAKEKTIRLLREHLGLNKKAKKSEEKNPKVKAKKVKGDSSVRLSDHKNHPDYTRNEL